MIAPVGAGADVIPDESKFPAVNAVAECGECGWRGRSRRAWVSAREDADRHNLAKHDLREYEVWSTYKVTGRAYVRARSAAEAIEKALDVTADDAVQFEFGEPHSETKMRARWIR